MIIKKSTIKLAILSIVILFVGVNIGYIVGGIVINNQLAGTACAYYAIYGSFSANPGNYSVYNDDVGITHIVYDKNATLESYPNSTSMRQNFAVYKMNSKPQFHRVDFDLIGKYRFDCCFVTFENVTLIDQIKLGYIQ